jgi:protein-S-isoprenylcysteine O-methyltransferase
MSFVSPWDWFPSIYVACLFVATFIAWWGTERLYIPRGTDSQRQLRDHGSRLINVLTIYVSIALCFIVRSLGVGLVDTLLQVSGMVLMVAGILFRAWAIHVLGRHFSVHVAIQTSHELVTSGPYRWFRHPSYTGTLMTLVGLPIALGVWPMVIFVSVAFVAAHIFRIRVEEAAMAEAFGEAYTSYCKSTWRMFPGW